MAVREAGERDLRLAIGRDRALLGAQLAQLERMAAAYAAAHGDRASLDDIAKLSAHHRARADALKGRSFGAGEVAELFSVLDDMREGLFAEAIADDLPLEVREAAGEAARRDAQALYDHYRKVKDTRDRLRGLGDELLQNLDDGDTTMPQDTPASSSPFASGGFVTPQRSGVRFNSVSDQLVSTLDRLGLPHDGGWLDPASTDPRVLERLIKGLDARFDTTATPQGIKAAPRVFADRGPASDTGQLAGRLKIDARAVSVDIGALRALIAGLPNLMRLTIRDDGPEARARRTIEFDLDELERIVQQPTGFSQRHAEARLNQLGSRLSELLATLGLSGASKQFAGIDFAGGGVLTRDQIKVPESTARREMVAAELEEIVVLANRIAARFARLHRARTVGESAARLESSMDAAARCIDEIDYALSTVHLTASLDRWQAIELDVFDVGASRENLADGLRNAVAWLRPLTARFQRADFAAEDMLPGEASDLAGELDDIRKVLDNCVAHLKTALAAADPRFVRQVEDLATLTRAAAMLAGDLAKA